MPPFKKTADGRSDGSKPRNIADTKGFQSSSKSVKRFWGNYKAILKDSFNRMSRQEQEELIDKFAMIVTVGVTCLVVLIFYPVIPRTLRVFGLPVALLSAWWAGRRVVGPVVIDRMSSLLKKEERRERDDTEDFDVRDDRDER